ncbi:hypothetical protein B0T17DRAFT_504358 [Bombardia bombarda]|uniref:NADH:flavin oxidoreductase/NADH oxidase N-terminal domain-containing protein n=1 Tax=Bombardia bombarda TaxID=252184 RepID=A0AA40CG30_9PEZI|nr:hypothetical protein B0T17DRAFT_504358 [Bombardia bombarda]
MTVEESKLFQPLTVGTSKLQHRIAMAPLTRCRADENYVPTLPLMKEYYSQRAAVPGTLLVSEGTFISPSASGFPGMPGIYNDAQIAAWKEITDAVHAKGSFIYVQLWSLGRAADPRVAEQEGFTIKSSSAIPSTTNRPPPSP